MTGPFDRSVLYSIEAQPQSARTIPALTLAFRNREAKEDKQWIAATLLRLGETSKVYFQYLADYAAVVADDRTPFSLGYDAAGNSVRGEFDAAGFENWCALNHKDRREVAGIQLSSYPKDIQVLAYAQDRRSGELFKRALQSPNPLAVAYAVEGLGRLNETAAIPLISEAIDRLHTGDRLAIAMMLPWFTSPQAFQLMRHLVPDSGMEGSLRRMVDGQRLAELNRATRREGQQPQPGKLE
jgi:hypothetical protein